MLLPSQGAHGRGRRRPLLLLRLQMAALANLPAEEARPRMAHESSLVAGITSSSSSELNLVIREAAGATAGSNDGGEPPRPLGEKEPPGDGVVQPSSSSRVADQPQASMSKPIPRQRPKVGARKNQHRYCFLARGLLGRCFLLWPLRDFPFLVVHRAASRKPWDAARHLHL